MKIFWTLCLCFCQVEWRREGGRDLTSQKIYLCPRGGMWSLCTLAHLPTEDVDTHDVPCLKYKQDFSLEAFILTTTLLPPILTRVLYFDDWRKCINERRYWKASAAVIRQRKEKSLLVPIKCFQIEWRFSKKEDLKNYIICEKSWILYIFIIDSRQSQVWDSVNERRNAELTGLDK